jgi:hypothetical protein
MLKRGILGMPPPDIGGVGDDDAIQSVFIYELFVILCVF